MNRDTQILFVIYYIKLEKKSHMIISVSADKAFDKTQHLFHENSQKNKNRCLGLDCVSQKDVFKS